MSARLGPAALLPLLSRPAYGISCFQDQAVGEDPVLEECADESYICASFSHGANSVGAKVFGCYTSGQCRVLAETGQFPPPSSISVSDVECCEESGCNRPHGASEGDPSGDDDGDAAAVDDDSGSTGGDDWSGSSPGDSTRDGLLRCFESGELGLEPTVTHCRNADDVCVSMIMSTGFEPDAPAFGCYSRDECQEMADTGSFPELRTVRVGNVTCCEHDECNDPQGHNASTGRPSRPRRPPRRQHKSSKGGNHSEGRGSHHNSAKPADESHGDKGGHHDSSKSGEGLAASGVAAQVGGRRRRSAPVGKRPPIPGGGRRRWSSAADGKSVSAPGVDNSSARESVGNESGAARRPLECFQSAGIGQRARLRPCENAEDICASIAMSLRANASSVNGVHHHCFLAAVCSEMQRTQRFPRSRIHAGNVTCCNRSACNSPVDEGLPVDGVEADAVMSSGPRRSPPARSGSKISAKGGESKSTSGGGRVCFQSLSSDGAPVAAPCEDPSYLCASMTLSVQQEARQMHYGCYSEHHCSEMAHSGVFPALISITVSNMTCCVADECNRPAADIPDPQAKFSDGVFPITGSHLTRGAGTALVCGLLALSAAPLALLCRRSRLSEGLSESTDKDCLISASA